MCQPSSLPELGRRALTQAANRTPQLNLIYHCTRGGRPHPSHPTFPFARWAGNLPESPETPLRFFFHDGWVTYSRQCPFAHFGRRVRTSHRRGETEPQVLTPCFPDLGSNFCCDSKWKPRVCSLTWVAVFIAPGNGHLKFPRLWWLFVAPRHGNPKFHRLSGDSRCAATWKQ